MKLTRLVLERYGHVSGEWLEFPPEVGLHVVLGANEAGKSTALEAVADGLFGFPTRQRKKVGHPDDPRVHPDDPRIGFSLRAADGVEASFVRRKTGRDKLLDGAGSPVPETALARFLGGTGRERFEEVFGLDGERLRQAGRAIMAEQGEAGAAILQAQTGMRGLREAADRLDAEAKTLFGDGRGQRVVSQAAEAIKANRRLVAERSVSGPDYLKARDRETALADQVKTIDAERQALRAEQARLNRVRATKPLRTELVAIAERLAALGPATALPSDAATQYDDAVTARDQAVRDYAREEGDLARTVDALGQLRPDPAILAESTNLSALEGDLKRIAGIRQDALLASGNANRSLATIDNHARRLGVAERGGAALRERVPDLAMRGAATRLLTQHTADAASIGAAADALRRAQDEMDEASQALAAAPELDGAEELREAVDEVRNAGPVEVELAKALARRDSTAAEADRLLKQLALWAADLSTLEGTAVPLEAEAARLGSELDVATEACRKAEDDVVAHEAAMEACRSAAATIESAGALPTTDAIAAMRARRDLAWRLLQRCRLEDGPPPAEGEWPHAVAPADLPRMFEDLLNQADELADARHDELVRVGEWERYQTEAGQLVEQQPVLLRNRDAARHRARQASTAWVAAWAPAEVLPQDAASMREWRRDRAAVLAAAGEARQAAQAYDQLAAQEVGLRTRLRALLPAGGADGLGACLRQATQLLRDRDKQATKRTAAADRVGKAVRDLAASRREHDRLTERVARWADDWAPVARHLGLPPDADPEVATDLLAAWTDLDNELDRWFELQGRLDQMRTAVEGHDAAVVALATRLGVPVTATLVADSAERCRAAQAVVDEQVRLDAVLKQQREAADTARRAEEDAEGRLAVLCRAAGVVDDAGLQAAIAAVAERVVLTGRWEDRQTALGPLADGKTEAELADEEAELDIDAIPGRLEAIVARMGELDTMSGEVATSLAGERQELQAMEAGQDVAGPSQAVQDSLAAMEDAAYRYVRLRLAHALLGGGMDSYRRSQQGPLLAKASELFGALTGERYVRLEQDQGDKGELFIVAVRADGSTCPVWALSEGTTDQLFLALRLASIALEAGASEPMPFIADDLLVNFDDTRAAAALGLLAAFGRTNQVILFTHHQHLIGLLEPGTAMVHRLPRELVPG